MNRALALLFALALGALLLPGCPHAGDVSPDPLRARTGEGCAPDIRDNSCVACMKRSCCAEMAACKTMDRCPCTFLCMGDRNNDPACGPTCPLPEDRALAICGATACQDYCGGRKGS
jgi:hypothetical protein